MADVSVVIVSFNTRELLARCLESLFEACQSVSAEVIVVDNASSDGSVVMLHNRFPDVKTISNATNVGFAAANNQGIERSTADVILLLNSDAFMNERALLDGLRVLASNPRVGLAGVRLDNEDGTFQAGHGSFPTLWNDISTSLGFDQLVRWHAMALSEAGPVDWVQGACMFARREAVSEVGGLDSHFFMYSEEVDWCWRFWRAGWEVWQLADVSIVHLGGGSSKTNHLGRRVALYRSRLSLRRRLGGPAASTVLWIAMVAGLTGRIGLRSVAGMVLRRNLGRQSASTDFDLLRAILHMDPLAR